MVGGQTDGVSTPHARDCYMTMMTMYRVSCEHTRYSMLRSEVDGMGLGWTKLVVGVTGSDTTRGRWPSL